MTGPDETPHLILHMVRGHAAFDIGQPLYVNDEQWWIIPTSGHRAYPFRWWLLEDLVDVSDINRSGSHNRPTEFEETVPADWPDHYAVNVVKTNKEKLIEALINKVTDEEVDEALIELGFTE